MAETSFFSRPRIRAISTMLPSGSLDLRDLADEYPDYDIEKVIKGTGIKRVTIADENTTSSDLCVAAAQKLFEAGIVSPEKIDGVVFVTETADYIIPHTAAVIQDRLGIPTDSITFDLHFGCPGYAYGLFQAFMMIETGFCKKVLLCAGDTVSKLVNPKDRALRMVIGDAGSATLIDNEGTSRSSFSFYTNGGGSKHLIVPAGGFRKPSLAGVTDILSYDNDGNARSEDDLFMNGMEIMVFALREVRGIIEKNMAAMNWTNDDVDLFALHQANEIILKRVSRQLKVAPEKVPISMENTGNTGFVSIPLMLTNLYAGINEHLKKVIVCGFGAGLAIASTAVDLSDTIILPTGIIKEEDL